MNKIKEIQEKTKVEFLQFQIEELSKPNIEIFQDCGKIRFYLEINDFIQNLETEKEYFGMVEEEIVALYDKIKSPLISFMWNNGYLEDEYVNIDDYDGINNLISLLYGNYVNGGERQ